MSDDDLIRRGDALQLVEDYETIHDRISLLPAAFPARGVGVPADVRDYAIDVSEAFDTMMEVERNPAGAWQAIQALAGHIAALTPTDAAQAREAAIRECAGALRKVIDYAAFAGADPDEVDDEAINSYADYLLTLIERGRP
jgi:hypothetical protein